MATATKLTGRDIQGHLQKLASAFRSLEFIIDAEKENTAAERGDRNVHSDSHQSLCMMHKKDNSLKFTILFNNHKGNRVRVSFSWLENPQNVLPYDRRGEASSIYEMSWDITRDPTAIVNDFARRVLPIATGIHMALVDYRSKWDKANSKRDLAVEAILAKFGGKASTPRGDKNTGERTISFYGERNMPACINDVQVNDGGESVEIKLQSVSPEKAILIIEAIKNIMPPRTKGLPDDEE